MSFGPRTKRLVIVVGALLLTFCLWATKAHWIKVVGVKGFAALQLVRGSLPTPSTVEAKRWSKAPYSGLSEPRWSEMNRRDKEDPSWEWKMPLDFFGKVVDEHGLGIAGAKVRFQWTNLSAEGSDEGETASNAEGLFALVGKTGKILGVRVSKDGYYNPLNERVRNFEYADFSSGEFYVPDPSHPVLFHLRTMHPAEPVLVGHIQVHLPADGTPIRIDLLKGGAVSPEGQLEIAAVTNTSDYPPRFFDWKATISVPDGGLLEHSDDFPFEAPAAGYAPKARFDFPTKDEAKWKERLIKDYYIQFGQPPNYGRFQISLGGADQRAILAFCVNASGSRNLEGGGPRTSSP